MTPMPPPPARPAAPAPPPNTSELNPDEIAQETGYPVQRVIADIKQTGATTKEELYPQFYGGQGIQPDAAAIGAGYGDDDGDEAALPPAAAAGAAAPVADDMNEPPQRMAARQAMSGEAAPPMQPEPEVPEENALGVGATSRKPFDVHDRARRMRTQH